MAHEVDAAHMPRILLVDDDATERALIRTVLQDALPTATLAECEDGAAGLQRFDEGWDLALVDLAMPGLKGVQVLEEMARRKRDLATPTILVALTGADDARQTMEVFEQGAGFLAKPVTPQGLRELAERVVGMLAGDERPDVPIGAEATN